MTQDEKIEEFYLRVATLEYNDPPMKKKILFEVIHDFWQEIGVHPEIIKQICAKLRISKDMFNVCVDDPSLIFGIENLSQYVQGGWLRDYLDFTATHEAPEEFHLWVGLTIMSAAIRWNAILRYSKFNVHTNLYTILVSPPATCRKTTAADIGVDLMLKGSDCKLIRDKITPERMCAILSKLTRIRPTESGGIAIEATASQCLVYAPELTVFLGKESYMEGLARFLTTIYDCRDRWEYETVKAKTIALNNHYVSFLACTTPTELPCAITNMTTEGGLLSRITLIYKTTTPRCYPIPITETPRENTLRETLTSGLTEMSNMVPIHFTLASDGAEWYTEWYTTWKKNMERGDPTMVFARRNDIFIFKLAMLLSVSENLGPEIKADTLQRASYILASSNESMKTVLGMIGSDSAFDRPDVATKIMACIDSAGGTIGRSQLLRKMYHKRLLIRDMEPTLTALKQANLLIEFFKDKRHYFTKVRKFEDD